MLLFEVDRRQIAQRQVRALDVVVRTPSLDDDLRFAAAAELLQVQAFVAQAPVERFVGAILPRLSGIDMGRFHAAVSQPLQHRGADELGAIVSLIRMGLMGAEE